jgi:formylglycine-generating enzyme required for sulfatase activity
MNRMNKILLCGLLLCLFRKTAGWLATVAILVASVLVVEASDPVVSNVQAAQRPGTHKVDIRYDVADADGDVLWITVKVLDKGEAYGGASYVVPAASFSGDIGFGIKPGLGKHIVWDAWVDWGGKYSANMRFRLTASDTLPEILAEPPDMVWIRSGTFTMGSPSNEKDRYEGSGGWAGHGEEGPQTKVTISRGFGMSKYKVTQAQYKAVMGTNPSRTHKGDNYPVEYVSWHEAAAYCAKLTEKEKAAGGLPRGYEYRLPTEAEWEYACRAGTTTRFSYGDDLDYSQLGEYAWYIPDSSNTTHPVGEKKPNGWGLYGMHGHVWEWCQDWYGNYPGGSVTDPQGPATGSYRMRRGGCFDVGADDCRSARRTYTEPGNRGGDVGFRPVLAPTTNP